jgi:CheY-like chemotaxis protein
MPSLLAAADDRLVADLGVTALARAGIGLRTVNDGEDLVGLAVETGAGAVLLSDREGCLEPLASCRALRADPRTSRIPVVLVGSWAARARGRSAGVDTFVPRFAPSHELARAVSSALALPERSARRWLVDLPCSIVADRERFAGRCTDLSLSGCRLVLGPKPPASGGQLSLRLETAGDTLELAASLARVDASRADRAVVGLAFYELDAPQQSRLSHALRAAAGRRAVADGEHQAGERAP